MKNKILILAMLGVFSANHIHSDEIEEVVVQASILNVTQDKIGDPLHILSGTDISDLGTTDLGGTLDSLLGVTTSDYGTAVGQPIIRGLSGLVNNKGSRSLSASPASPNIDSFNCGSADKFVTSSRLNVALEYNG